MRVQMYNCKKICETKFKKLEAHFGKFPNSIAMKWIETNNETDVVTDDYSEREAFFEFMLPMLGFFFALTFMEGQHVFKYLTILMDFSSSSSSHLGSTAKVTMEVLELF